MTRMAKDLEAGDTIRLVGESRKVLSVEPHDDSEKLVVVVTDYPAWPRLVCDPTATFALL